MAKSRVSVLEKEKQQSVHPKNRNSFVQRKGTTEKVEAKKESVTPNREADDDLEEKVLNTSFEKNAKQLNRRISRLSLRSEPGLREKMMRLAYQIKVLVKLMAVNWHPGYSSLIRLMTVGNVLQK